MSSPTAKASNGPTRASRRQVFFNGRFLQARSTGVQRVARELLRAFDETLNANPVPGIDWKLIKPPHTEDPGYRHISTAQHGGLPSQAWEQIELPLFSRGGLLVNLCNTAPLYGDRMVVMIHDAQVFTTPESYSPEFVSWYRFLLPRIGQRADRVLTVSNFSRQQLHAHGICPLEKIEVIPNGIDHLDRSAPDVGLLEYLQLKSGSYVLALASTQLHKNTNILLKAFSSGKLKGLKLVLFGEATESALRESGFSPPPGTVFTGPVSDGALRGLMAHALCFACPSKTEGFGLPPLEAMTQGCPAIVAPCGALPEACGDAALYADPSDPVAWQDAILTLAENPELRLDYAARAREQASRFTWAAAAKRLADVVTTLA